MRKEFGNYGEQKAAEYLLKQGYGVLRRNFRTRYGEIDIIAEHNGALVFCEVKSRHTARYGTGAEAVDIRKQRKISRAAAEYLQENGLMDCAVRFDVIAILARNGETHIDHIINAFDFIDGE